MKMSVGLGFMFCYFLAVLSTITDGSIPHKDNNMAAPKKEGMSPLFISQSTILPKFPKFTNTKRQGCAVSFCQSSVLGLRSYVLGLICLQSQPNNSYKVGSLAYECSGVLGFRARPC